MNQRIAQNSSKWQKLHALSDSSVAAADYLWVFRWALAAFIVAALTGSLMRYGMIYGFPWQLQFGNVRHAHSHLMYFGWVTPGLFALIAATVVSQGAKPLSQGFRSSIIVTFISAALAYFPFLLSGYQLMAVGESLRLPLSMMAAGLNGLAWYIFILCYCISTWRVARTTVLYAFDAALLLLFLSSLGAWGLASMAFLPFAPASMMSSFVSFFLDLFSNGWFALALLGLFLARFPDFRQDKLAQLSLGLITVGLIVLSFTELLRTAYGYQSFGALLSGCGFIIIITLLAKTALHSKAYGFVLMLSLLAFKAVVAILLTVPAIATGFMQLGLKIPLLHSYLLGFVSLSLIGLFSQKIAVHWQFWLMAAAVLLLLVSLLPLTGLWPADLRTYWALRFAFGISFLPALVALVILTDMKRL